MSTQAAPVKMGRAAEIPLPVQGLIERLQVVAKQLDDLATKAKCCPMLSPEGRGQVYGRLVASLETIQMARVVLQLAGERQPMHLELLDPEVREVEEPPEPDDRALCSICGQAVDDAEYDDNHGVHAACAANRDAQLEEGALESDPEPVEPF